MLQMYCTVLMAPGHLCTCSEIFWNDFNSEDWARLGLVKAGQPSISICTLWFV